MRPGRALLAGAAAAVLATTPAWAATPRSTGLHEPISVPSVLSSNGKRVWLANTGSSSVLELSAYSGRELLNVKGSKFKFDNSDAITQYGNDVWVSNEASDTVTEFAATTGTLRHVLHGPTFHFAIPTQLVAVDRHVYVLDAAGDKITVIVERNGRLARYLEGPRFHLDHAVAIVRAGQDLWAVSADGTLTELSGATGGVLRVVVGPTAHLVHPVAATTNGADLLVADAGTGTVTVLSAATGRYLGSISTGAVPLRRATSIAATDGTIWVASTASPAFVVGLRARGGTTVHVFRHRFTFPAVFADARHVWVVDRIQSRVTELAPTTGSVLRTLVN